MLFSLKCSSDDTRCTGGGVEGGEFDGTSTDGARGCKNSILLGRLTLSRAGNADRGAGGVVCDLGVDDDAAGAGEATWDKIVWTVTVLLFAAFGIGVSVVSVVTANCICPLCGADSDGICEPIRLIVATGDGAAVSYMELVLMEVPFRCSPNRLAPTLGKGVGWPSAILTWTDTLPCLGVNLTAEINKV